MESLVNAISQSMCAFDWSAAANWASALATAFAALVALKGINAWRQEHTGKTKYESARNILKLIHQIQGLLRLEPIAFHRGERLDPEVFISSFPDQFVDIVLESAQDKWAEVNNLIKDLYLEGIGSRGILGDDIAERIRVIVSSLRVTDPSYKSTYVPTPSQMGGEKLTPEQFSQRSRTNAILNLPSRLADLENLLVKYLNP